MFLLWATGNDRGDLRRLLRHLRLDQKDEVETIGTSCSTWANTTAGATIDEGTIEDITHEGTTGTIRIGGETMTIVGMDVETIITKGEGVEARRVVRGTESQKDMLLLQSIMHPMYRLMSSFRID